MTTTEIQKELKIPSENAYRMAVARELLWLLSLPSNIWSGPCPAYVCRPIIAFFYRAGPIILKVYKSNRKDLWQPMRSLPLSFLAKSNTITELPTSLTIYSGFASSRARSFGTNLAPQRRFMAWLTMSVSCVLATSSPTIDRTSVSVTG